MSFEFEVLINSEEKSKVCEKILRSLPKWFGIEISIINYIRDVQSMPMILAKDKSEVIGFISLKKHNLQTAEIHVMGIIEKYHRQKIGKTLIEKAESYLASVNFEYLTVKTLSESRTNEEYDRTRRFYLAMGFTPLEEFKTLWDEHNPCLFLVKTLSKSGSLHHIEIYVSSLERSIYFWSWFLTKLGYREYQNWKLGRSYKKDNTYLVFVQTNEKYLDIPYHRCQTGLNHLAFHASSKEMVEQITKELREKGIKILYEDKPSNAGANNCSVYFEDPDRIKVELVAP